MSVGQRLVRQGPEALDALQCWGIRRQKVQMSAHRDVDLRTHMPPSTVKHQQDMLALAGSDDLGELGKRDRERGD